MNTSQSTPPSPASRIPQSPVAPPPVRMTTPYAMLSVFGLGMMRPASGTWGSLPPVIIAGILMLAGLGPLDAPVLYTLVLLGVMLVFSAACVMFGDRGEARWGHDPKEVVADEVAGQCIPLLLLPAATLATPTLTIFTLVFSFLAFRVFDVAKVWPADALQRIPGGWGVLLDDIAAGAITALVIISLSTAML